MANKQKQTQAKRHPNITFEDARIIFRNFEGKGDRFNPEGRRNFCVLLDPDTAETLTADGWNVRWLKPRDEGDEKQAYMQVSVSYLNRPPKIVLISPSTGKQTFLSEDDVHILDWADMKTVDFIVNPYQWEVNGKSGVKAYLGKMFVTIIEDELELKYANSGQDEPVAIEIDVEEEPV